MSQETKLFSAANPRKLLFGTSTRQGTNRERPLGFNDIHEFDFLGQGFPQLYGNSIIAKGPQLLNTNWSLQCYLVRSNHEQARLRVYKLVGVRTSHYATIDYSEESDPSDNLADAIIQANHSIRDLVARSQGQTKVEDESKLFSVPSVLAEFEREVAATQEDW